MKELGFILLVRFKSYVNTKKGFEKLIWSSFAILRESNSHLYWDALRIIGMYGNIPFHYFLNLQKIGTKIQGLA